MSERERLRKQIDFVIEADRLKNVLRRTLLTDGSRRENAAEHSWHLCLMAIALAEHAGTEGLDLLRVIKMLIVHDLVEIDAGDTFCYDEAGQAARIERERSAADRIFGGLPPDQRAEMRSLWDEFEARETPESRFCAALDRLQPLLHNWMTGGAAWREHGVTQSMALDKNRHIAQGSARLWEYAEELIRDASRKGRLPAE